MLHNKKYSETAQTYIIIHLIHVSPGHLWVRVRAQLSWVPGQGFLQAARCWLRLLFHCKAPPGGSAAKLTHDGAWQASGPPDCWPETGVPCHVGFSLGQVTTGELSSLRVSTEEIVQPRPTPP